MPTLRHPSCGVRFRQVVLTAGSWAIDLCEPRQIRKEAAVSGSVNVPQGSLARANCRRAARSWMSKVGHGQIVIMTIALGDCFALAGIFKV